MRIRSIRPEFWTSEDVATMDWHTRLIFIGLWSYVDDNGVGRDNHRLILASLFALDDDQSESSRRLAAGILALQQGGQITRYEVDGKPYLHITAWSKNQRTDNAGKQRYPLPTSTAAALTPAPAEPVATLAATRGDSLLGEGEKGRRGEVVLGETPAEPKPARAPSKRLLPDNWSPTDAHRKRCADNNLDLDETVDAFRDHHRSKASKFASWDHAFNTWIRNAIKFRDEENARKALRATGTEGGSVTHLLNHTPLARRR